MLIRRYRDGDLSEWLRLSQALFPTLPREELEADMDVLHSRADAEVFVLERPTGLLAGYVEVGTRPYADGCVTSPVGYVEAWYVDTDVRRAGHGRALLAAAEDWARARGYREMASDALLDNEVSQQAHQRAGYAIVDTIVQFRKELESGSSGRTGTRSSILWRRLDMPGHEVAELVSDHTGSLLSGVALVAHEGRACRVEYEIECDASWQTRRVTLRGHLGGVPVALELSRSPDGAWYANGVIVPAVQGCMDVDLEFSPSTNLLPIRRLDLAVGRRATVRVAWVRFPALTLELFEQEYARVGEATYVFESADGTFRRELSVNADGFVLEYPDFWRAEASTPASR